MQQAEQGKSLYLKTCAACHGPTLKGSSAPALAGPAFASAWNVSLFGGNWAQSQTTIGDLDFIIRTTMPRGAAGSLSASDYTAVLSFILQQNGYDPGPTPLRTGSSHMKSALRLTAAKDVAEHDSPLRLAGEAKDTPTGGGPTQEELSGAQSSTRNWLYQTHDYAGTRYATVDQINPQNAAQLRPVCVYQIGDDGGNFESGPLVYNGMMYLTTVSTTVAVDATSCREKWRYRWLPRARDVWRNNRGAAIKDGFLVRGTSDGYLLALNAASGALVWAVKAADSAKGEGFAMPPLIYEDLILIGPTGGENAISGWVGAFNLHDGTPIWKFQTVADATATESKSWGNPHGIKLGGGSVWTPLSLDVENGELMVAVTNPSPDLPANLRPGANLYTNSAVALDVRTGKLLWYKQIIPNDSHDWDLTQVSPLFRTTVDGHPVSLVATVGKDGVLRTVDRATHDIVYATPVTTVTDHDVVVPPEGVTACPGALGGVEWNGPAFSPALNMLFVNAVDWCGRYTAARTVRYIPGHLYMGGTFEFSGDSKGWLTAIDASTGAVKWKYRSPRPLLSAVTVTSGGVVFTGELNGDFLSFAASDGRELYRFNTGGGIGGGIVTYEEHGKQYVGVMSGKPGAIDPGGSPTVFIFALNEFCRSASPSF